MLRQTAHNREKAGSEQTCITLFKKPITKTRFLLVRSKSIWASAKEASQLHVNKRQGRRWSTTIQDWWNLYTLSELVQGGNSPDARHEGSRRVVYAYSVAVAICYIHKIFGRFGVELALWTCETVAMAWWACAKKVCKNGDASEDFLYIFMRCRRIAILSVGNWHGVEESRRGLRREWSWEVDGGAYGKNPSLLVHGGQSNVQCSSKKLGSLNGIRIH